MEEAAQTYTAPSISQASFIQQQSSPMKAEDPINITVEERIILAVNRDGGVDHLEVKGDLLLKICKEEYSKVLVRLDQNVDQKAVQFKVITILTLDSSKRGQKTIF